MTGSNSHAHKSFVRFNLSRIALVLLTGTIASTGAALESVEGTQAGQMDHSHHHHHHAPPPTLQRSLASYAIPDVDMVDQNGRTVALRSLLNRDQPVLVNFIYTTCTAICPVMSASFQQVQRALGDDSGKVTMVSVSIDPEQDTPTELARYAQRFDAGPQWHFLTGTLEDSISVQKAFDAYRVDKMSHAPVTFVRARPDAEWIRYDGFVNADDVAQESRAMIGQ